MSDTDTIPPINWTNASGERNGKIDRIVTELVRQAREKDFTAYRRRDIEQAIQVLAEVGDESTIDGYVQQVGMTDAFNPTSGTFKLTDEAFDRYEEERA